jgi:ABC-type polar amino acid transport system ATPase subunit
MSPYERKDVLLKLTNVSLAFDGKTILKDINVEVRDIVRPGMIQGQIIGVLGPSGIGKTQLSRIMTGLQPPTSGTITVGAKNDPVRAGLVGYVPQNYPLLRHRTVLGNLIIAAKRAGSSEHEAKDKAMDYLKRFEMADKWDVYPAQLSGGQRQRIAIAQQLLCSEHYLILDEPTTGLDPIMKDRVCEFIKQVANISEENTMIVITHDIAAVMAIADTLWILGRVRDAEGNSQGAKIVETYDLIDRGIAWQSNAPSLPAFQDLVREVRAKFETL